LIHYVDRREIFSDGKFKPFVLVCIYTERRLWEKNIRLIAGIDEAGRGPLAGPVVAAVVILREELFLPELNDSKCVSERLRNKLAGEIKAKAAGWGIGIASVGFIEAL